MQVEKGKPKGKCRKWKLVVSLGRDARTGKYPQKARAFHDTYTQAQKALAEFVAEINGGAVVRCRNYSRKLERHYRKGKGGLAGRESNRWNDS
ncbi:MAG: hypothetical protein Q4D27_10205 [Coriobacteriia bacterium]|nr:hypothetical protein [Coriobacteriia bacterium]